MVQVREADTQQKRVRIFDGKDSEWWFVKSNMRMSVEEDDTQTIDQPVFLMMHVQFWKCVSLCKLHEYQKEIGGQEIYDWCIDRPSDKYGIVQLWNILETCRVPVCMTHLSDTELEEEHHRGTTLIGQSITTTVPL